MGETIDEVQPEQPTELDKRHMLALDAWVGDPNYAAVGRKFDVSRVTARRWVLKAVQVRINEILPNADEYLTLTVQRIEDRLARLDRVITNDALDLDDQLDAMKVERGYIADLVKLLGLAAPEKHAHLVALTEIRPLTDEERKQRVAKLLTAGTLLDDTDDANPDGRDPTGASNGRPVGPAPQE